MIWPGCELFSHQSHPGPHKSFRRFFFQQSKLCETCPRIRQVSRPINVLIIINALLWTSKFIWVVLVTSMHFSGIGNDSSLWWRHMQFPDMDQKSFIASPASRNESWGCGRDPSDSPRQSMWLSPWIGRCRIKVDVLSSWYDWKNKFSFYGKCHFFRIESFRLMDSWLVLRSDRVTFNNEPDGMTGPWNVCPENRSVTFRRWV